MARILVVDDEEDLRVLTGKFLSIEGHDVDLAKGGDEAFKWMNEYDYDLVILDVIMPGKNGVQVVEDMKKTERLRDIPIILFTVLESDVMLRLTDETRPDDYIQKPFAKEEFLLKVEKLLSKAK